MSWSKQKWHNQTWILGKSYQDDFNKWKLLNPTSFILTIIRGKQREVNSITLIGGRYSGLEPNSHLNTFLEWFHISEAIILHFSTNSCSYSSGYDFGSANQIHCHDIHMINVMWRLLMLLFFFLISTCKDHHRVSGFLLQH